MKKAMTSKNTVPVFRDSDTRPMKEILADTSSNGQYMAFRRELFYCLLHGFIQCFLGNVKLNMVL